MSGLVQVGWLDDEGPGSPPASLVPLGADTSGYRRRRPVFVVDCSRCEGRGWVTLWGGTDEPAEYRPANPPPYSPPNCVPCLLCGPLRSAYLTERPADVEPF